MMVDAILAQVQQVGELNRQIREFINANPRVQWGLIGDEWAWYRLCSAMDTIDDNCLALCAFLEDATDGRDAGTNYLRAYGLLQVLFVQQDAADVLLATCGVEMQGSAKIDEIRDIRNRAIGHPAETKRTKPAAAHMIDRVSMSGFQFALRTLPEVGKPDRCRVHLPEVISKQCDHLVAFFQEVLGRLKEMQDEHTRKFRGSPICDAIHPSFRYMIGKLQEYVDRPSEAPFANIEQLEAIVQAFRDQLEARGELAPRKHIQDLIADAQYAINHLRGYFLRAEGNYLKAKDAYIFLHFLDAKMAEMRKVAAEIDEDYAKAADGGG